MLTRTERHGRDAGFTLVELMVVVVIASILLSIAVPSYLTQVRKSRRTEARTAVLDLATREERFLSTANFYSATPTDLGYAGAFPQNVGSGYYSITVAVTAANPAAAPPVLAGYTITATAIGTQLKDAQCRTFSVNQIGQQTAQDSGGGNQNTTCWGN